MAISINLARANLRQNQSGTVSGRLWLSFDSGPFPEKNWDDFVVAVLNGISEALSAIESDAPRSRCTFYEGPYDLRFTRRDSGTALLQASARGLDSHLFAHFAEIDLSAFREQVDDARATLSAWCAEHGFVSDEIARLTASVPSIRNLDNFLGAWMHDIDFEGVTDEEQMTLFVHGTSAKHVFQVAVEMQSVIDHPAGLRSAIVGASNRHLESDDEMVQWLRDLLNAIVRASSDEKLCEYFAANGKLPM